MQLESLTAISPLDGRYRNRLTQLAELVSELALQRYRVRIELRWFEHLAGERTISELPPLSATARKLIRRRSRLQRRGRRPHQRDRAHDQPRREGGRILREGKASRVPELAPHIEFVHFACTSEDINNLAHALTLKDARDGSHPAADAAADRRDSSERTAFADIAMLSRTHGQAASPTTMGKELANVGKRLERQRDSFGPWRSSANSTGRLAISMRTLPPIRNRLASRIARLRRVAGSRIQPVYDADRTTRLHRGVLPRAVPFQSGVARFQSRHLGLHLHRILRAATS